MIKPIVDLCGIVVLWLSLQAGVSRQTANVVLKALKFIISTTIQLLCSALLAVSIHLPPVPEIRLPIDIRTLYKQNKLEPDLIRIICCPKCFTQYPSGHLLPRHCSWKRSPRSRRCGELLYTEKGGKQIPCCLYTTQSLDSWLSFFLSRSSIVDALQATFTRPPPQPGRMHDIHDSPAWQSFRPFLRSPFHLIFGLYIDWFNPFTNKIAGSFVVSLVLGVFLTVQYNSGKSVSCGAIVLYCLNLPLSLRFLPENVYVLGMIPGPHEPDVWTISHVLAAAQKMLLRFDLPGKILPICRHPEGVMVAARVIPLIADLPAIRKVAGFLSHAAKPFCSFCKCLHDNLEDLDFGNWMPRDGIEVRNQAEEWKGAITVSAKEALAKKTGVRWTPLHDLPYWDPVKHVVLGFMHNFLEGVLQHQLRILWGIGRPKAATARAMKDLPTGDQDDLISTTDIPDSHEPSEDEVSDAESASGLTDVFNRMDVDDNIISHDSEDDSDTPTPHLFPTPLLPPTSLDDLEDLDEITSFPPNMFDFTPEQLGKIQTCIQDVLLPTWVQRPPRNLGEASHGKLKAHELLVLFSSIFPLIIPELWSSQGEHEDQLLASFCDLVCATNIISAYSVTEEEANMYTIHYVNYRSSIQQLFPGFPSVPNHHFAMHNAELLKFWGPLSLLSEFPGERMNGDFGKVKTNRRLGESLYAHMSIYSPILHHRLYGVDNGSPRLPTRSIASHASW